MISSRPIRSLLVLPAMMIASAHTGCVVAPEGTGGKSSTTSTATAATGTGGATTGTTTGTTTSSTGSSSTSTSTGAGTPGDIACGTASCKVGMEHCCTVTENGATTQACVADGTSPPCTTGANPTKVTVASCDDASDCSTGQECCTDHSSDVLYTTHCVMPTTPNTAACNLLEVCVPGSSCVTSGTSCVMGTCQVTDPHVNCNNTTCSGATPACCWDGMNPTCVSGATCNGGGNSFQCTKPSECGGGEQCCGYPGGMDFSGAYCSGSCDISNQFIMCGGDSDCPALAPHCKPNTNGGFWAWLTSCQQ